MKNETSNNHHTANDGNVPVIGSGGEKVVIPIVDEIGADFDWDADDFQPCSECDGHDACRDFGCAVELGLGHMIKPPL